MAEKIAPQQMARRAVGNMLDAVRDAHLALQRAENARLEVIEFSDKKTDRPEGRGKDDQTHRANRPIKEVLGYPLRRDFREVLGRLS